MFVPKLNIQNFRIIANAVLDFTGTPLVFVRGKKFAGKSSIGQALSMILASTTDGLDGQGRGFEVKIKLGESKAFLMAHIQGKHLIERSVTLNTNTTGRTSRSVCIDDPDWHPLPFDNFLARYKDAMTVALNTGYFMSLGEKDQKALLAKLVLPERYDFPQDKVESTEKAIGQGVVNFSGEPFAVIELAYKKLYKEREQANRSVKDFMIPEPKVLASPVDSETLQKQLKDAREKRQSVLTEKDAAVRTANEVEVTRARLELTLETLRNQLVADEDVLSTAQANILSDEQVKRFTETAAKAKELDELKKQHSGWLGSIRTANDQIKRLTGLSDQGASCPTCEQSIDAEKIGVLVADLRKELVDADKNIQEIDTKIEAIGDVDEAVMSLKKHEDAKKKKAELDTSIAATITKGKKARADLDALAPKVDAAAPFTDRIASLDSQIDSITEQLRPVIEAEERKKDITAKTEQLKKLQDRAKTIDELVDYFGKDGIKAKLIAEYIGQFENSIRDVMGICGYKCSLTLEPFDFHVETARGYIGPVKELSGAEKHLFAATLQCAISIASGINVVVIDEMQELGDDLLSVFYPKLYDLIHSGSLEQAILMGYSPDKRIPPQEQQAPGSAYYFVENGVVTLLGKKETA